MNPLSKTAAFAVILVLLPVMLVGGLLKRLIPSKSEKPESRDENVVSVAEVAAAASASKAAAVRSDTRPPGAEPAKPAPEQSVHVAQGAEATAKTATATGMTISTARRSSVVGYHVAHRIFSFPLETSDGVLYAHARMYGYLNEDDPSQPGILRRSIKIYDPNLAVEAGCQDVDQTSTSGHVLHLDDGEYQPGRGFDHLIAPMVEEIRLIFQLDRREAAARRAAAEAAAAEAAAQANVLRQASEKAAQNATAMSVAFAQAQQSQPNASSAPVQPAPIAQTAPESRPAQFDPHQRRPQSAPRPTKGDVTIGHVVSAGIVQKSGVDGPYKTYCLTLNANGIEIPFNGTEIERLVIENRIQVGERVRLVSMGKHPVVIPGRDRPLFKNLYSLDRA